MKRRTKCLKISGHLSNEYDRTNLKRSDRDVLKYLQEVTLAGNRETCKASIPRIADACDISERQVQISTRRLIAAGLLKRIGYDFSNRDQKQRGTVYEVLIPNNKARQKIQQVGKKRTILFLMCWSED